MLQWWEGMIETVPYLMGCGGGKEYVEVKHQLLQALNSG